MSEKEATLRAVLGSQTNDKSVLSQAILDVLRTASNEEERTQLLAIAMTERDSVEKNPRALSNKGLTKEKWDELSTSLSRLAHEHFRVAFFKSHTVQDFSKGILKVIDHFEDHEEQTFVLGTCLFSPFIPYRELPGEPVRMTAQSIHHILNSSPKMQELIEYICEIPFSTTPELASMILQVLDDVPEKNARVAFLAHALSVFQARIADAVKSQTGKGL